MAFALEVQKVDGGRDSPKLDRKPNSCPVCHYRIDAEVVHGSLRARDPRKMLQVVYRCPQETCRCLFISNYGVPNDPAGKGYAYELVESIPLTPQVPEINDSVLSEVSPRFVEIYSSAIGAEAYGLTDLVGMGLRKALEFLMKDYAIKRHPEKKETIEREALSRVIADYFTSPGLKIAAERATWLGSDETHYKRVWETKDVEDLKGLVRLTMIWIESEVLTENLEKEMPKPA